MTRTIFVELGAGTAAVSHYLVGARRLTPYAGSKLKVASQICEHVQISSLQAFVWVELGEWARTLDVLSRDSFGVAVVLREWGWSRYEALQAGVDVRGWTDDYELFHQLRMKPPSDHPVVRAATHIFLQARNYNGKPVNPQVGSWTTHGFDPEYRDNKTRTSALTNNRGWASPRWRLADRIEKNAKCAWPAVHVHQADVVQFVEHADLNWSQAVVYFDPPYEGTMPYPFKLSRAQVLDVCFTLQAKGAQVLVSEAEPLGPLVEAGWTAHPLALAGRGQRAWKASKVQEWLTKSP